MNSKYVLSMSGNTALAKLQKKRKRDLDENGASHSNVTTFELFVKPNAKERFD